MKSQKQRRLCWLQLPRHLLLWVALIFCLIGVSACWDMQPAPPTAPAVILTPPPTPPVTPNEVALPVLPGGPADPLGQNASSTTPGTPPAERPATPPSNLSAAGPWLLLTDGSGLWAVNADGSGLTPIAPSGFVAPYNLGAAVAPSGSTVAYILAADAGLHGLRLVVTSLPDLNTWLVQPLTSAATEPAPGAAPGDPNFEIARALVEVTSLAWSPDGRQLAFMSAHEGPSADLYLFSLDDGNIRRLTDGSGQGIKPVWSPDGQTVVHASVSGLGTGAGYGMEAVYAAPADGSAVRILYDATSSGDEIITGWVAADTFVVYSFQTLCGFHNVRAVNVATGETRVLWSEAFGTLALDPSSGAILLSVGESGPECNPQNGPGLYLTGVNAQDSLRLSETTAGQLAWVPPWNVFLAQAADNVLAVVPGTGATTALASPLTNRLPLVSSDGQRLAWASAGLDRPPGLWLGPRDGEPRQILARAVHGAWWEPAGQNLLFVGEGNGNIPGALYVARAPNFTPELAAEGVRVVAAAWAGSGD